MNCRSCGGGVRPFMSFGEIPLGNAFLKEDDFPLEKRFNLELGFCHSCYLVQQTSPPPVADLHADYMNYAYVPFGITLKTHYLEMAKDIAATVKLGPGSFVVDIGSNNGMLLQFLRNLTGCKVLGVEPAQKISQMARDANVPTLTAFFDDNVAAKIANEHGLADLVLCTQVLQHIPEVKDFILNVRGLTKQRGTFMVEGRYFGATVQKRSFDTVYHEMIYFFTMNSLQELLSRSGLHPFKAAPNDIYGGSLRVYAQKDQSENPEKVPLLDMEEQQGLTKFGTYEQFAADVAKMRNNIRETVKGIEALGKTIAGYGAPSTSATLLNYCEIGRKELEYIVDDSELKQGLYTPGTHIQIASPLVLHANRPDYLLLLAWRLKEEILQKVKTERANGMKVIIPLPKVEVI